jgi:hypothetical protein
MYLMYLTSDGARKIRMLFSYKRMQIPTMNDQMKDKVDKGRARTPWMRSAAKQLKKYCPRWKKPSH